MEHFLLPSLKLLLTENFSDDKKIPLDKVTKQFFSGHKIFFLGTRFFSRHKIFFSCSKKNVLVERKKIMRLGKKCFVTMSRGIFLASEIISEGVKYLIA